MNYVGDDIFEQLTVTIEKHEDANTIWFSWYTNDGYLKEVAFSKDRNVFLNLYSGYYDDPHEVREIAHGKCMRMLPEGIKEGWICNGEEISEELLDTLDNDPKKIKLYLSLQML